MEMEFDVAAGTTPVASKVTMEMFDYGVPVSVTAPPAAEVSDLTSLLPSP
jgi:hypothetical protein